MKQVMNVEFLDNETVEIKYGGKTSNDLKEKLLNSFKYDIFKLGYIVEDDIHRQDFGDFFYYQFYYFDGTSSRDVWFQIPKNDLNSIHFVDQILLEIEKKKEEEIPDIIFEDEE